MGISREFLEADSTCRIQNAPCPDRSLLRLLLATFEMPAQVKRLTFGEILEAGCRYIFEAVESGFKVSNKEHMGSIRLLHV